jgi:hypothetical protein
MPRDVIELAKQMVDQVAGEPDEAWQAADWERATAEFRELVAAEESTFRLGEVLRRDVGMDLPVEAVKLTYERLFALGVRDARTRLCYARYLLLHGPDWDELANGIVAEVEDAARAAGLWDSPHLGHHPVFYADHPGR